MTADRFTGKRRRCVRFQSFVNYHSFPSWKSVLPLPCNRGATSSVSDGEPAEQAAAAADENTTRSLLFWEEEQLNDTREDSKRLADNFALENQEYATHLVALMKSGNDECERSEDGDLHMSQSIPTKTDAATHVTATTNDRGGEEATPKRQPLKQKIDDHLLHVVLSGGNVRGLEQFIVPLIRRYRRRATRVVLTIQERLKSKGILSTEAGRQLLRVKYLQASRPALLLALRMAEADRLHSQEQLFLPATTPSRLLLPSSAAAAAAPLSSSSPDETHE